MKSGKDDCLATHETLVLHLDWLIREIKALELEDERRSNASESPPEADPVAQKTDGAKVH